MKVTLLYCYRGEVKEKLVPIEDVIGMIRSGKYQKTVKALQEDLKFSCEGAEYKCAVESADNVPVIKWSKGENGYNGLIMLSLPCSSDTELEALRHNVNEYVQVLCSFRGSSGKSLKVIMPVELNDEGKTFSEFTADERSRFHTHAFLRTAGFMLGVTGISCSRKAASIDYGCRMSCDDKAYFNPDSVAMKVELPEKATEDDLPALNDIDFLKPRIDTLPGYSAKEMDVTRFNIIRRKVFNENENEKRDSSTSIIDLAEACAKAGIEEELAVKCALSMNLYQDKEMLVRTSFERAYEDIKPNKNKVLISKNIIEIELMERFLKARYHFRQNTVTGNVEYMENGKYVSSWKPFGERERNTICMAALKAGIDVWDKDISRYINSTMVETYDPIAEWIRQLPEWDGRDRIGELASTVKTDWDRWPEMFRQWMRSMVCQWRGINHLYGATMVLMFTGAQGTGKSTFFKRILPPGLLPYYVDRVDFTNKKEAERALIRFCLINLDEYDQISPRQTAFLKHMLQKSSIAYRKMYETDIEQRRRYAAFCATTNSDAPLTDPTGSRRYLVVEVTDKIDMSYAIDYPQLYAQVMDEIRRDMPTYFDSETEHEIQQHNVSYTTEMPLGTMFDNIFEPAKASDTAFEELTASEILLRMKEQYKTAIKVDKATATKLGSYLSHKGIRSIRVDDRRLYRLKTR